LSWENKSPENSPRQWHAGGFTAGTVMALMDLGLTFLSAAAGVLASDIKLFLSS
jgi:hypothetical protein